MKYIVFVLALVFATTLKTDMEGSFFLALPAIGLLILIKADDKFRKQERRYGRAGYKLRHRRPDYLAVRWRDDP